MAISNALNVGLSGAQAATQRFRASADNVANLRSVANPSTAPDRATESADGTTLFNPTRTVDQSTAGGGVLAANRLVNPSAVQQYDPTARDADENGLVNRPNVSLEREIVDQISAQRQFEANLITIRTADELAESALDILS
jgi:flagellar basal-body rod protein FlgC